MLVRVQEYVCTAAKGERPRVEHFSQTSIAIVRSGAFTLRSEHGTQLLSRGFLLVGNDGQPYEVLHEHQGGDCCLVFDYDAEVFDDVAERARRAQAGGPFARSVVPPHPRFEAIRRMAFERVADRDALGLEELGLALAREVLNLAGAGSPRPEPPRADRIARARIHAAVDRLERAADDVLLRELADAAGMSPFHFLRVFKRELGVTPHQLLIRLRIARAIDLLRDTARPVTDVAFDAGFGDVSNFVNTFRRQVGCSPGRFRKEGRPRERGHRLSTAVPGFSGF